MSPPELDLALSVADHLPAGLRAWAGPLAAADRAQERWADHLGSWLAALAGELPARRRSSRYSLGLRLTDDAEIAALNQTWRHRVGPTDVLAFAALDEGPGDTPALPLPPEAGEEGSEGLELGDIVISLETAARQAEAAGQTLELELLFLASHGLLHLLGWDHPDEASLAAMIERQERLLAPG
jgi:probable rRNA maturation factor